MNRLSMDEFSDFLKNGNIPEGESEDYSVNLFDSDQVLQRVLLPEEMSKKLLESMMEDVNQDWEDSIQVEVQGVDSDNHPDALQLKCLMNLSMEYSAEKMVDIFESTYKTAVRYPIELGLYEGHYSFNSIAPLYFRTGWDQAQGNKIIPLHEHDEFMKYGLEFNVDSSYAGTDLMLDFLRNVLLNDEIDRISDIDFIAGYDNCDDILEKYKSYKWLMTREFYDFVKEEYLDRYNIQETWESYKDATFYGFKVILSTVTEESLSDEHYYPMMFLKTSNVVFYYSKDFKCIRFEKIEHDEELAGLILYGEAGYRVFRPETVHVATL